MRKIIIVNDYFSGWNVLNWCEIEREREGLCLGGQSEVRLLHSMQLISITENVCTVTRLFTQVIAISVCACFCMHGKFQLVMYLS